MQSIPHAITTWHCHFELDYLLAHSDTELSEILTGGTPIEMRVELLCLKATGKKYLVSGDCDNKSPDGSCAGHKKPSQEG